MDLRSIGWVMWSMLAILPVLAMLAASIALVAKNRRPAHWVRLVGVTMVLTAGVGGTVHHFILMANGFYSAFPVVARVISGFGTLGWMIWATAECVMHFGRSRRQQ